MVDMTAFDKLFAGMVLPVRPAMAADGATIQLIQEDMPVVDAETPFFGGYAEDMLADIGFSMMDDHVQPEMRARKAS